jgi:PAS domain S-box-containing protein
MLTEFTGEIIDSLREPLIILDKNLSVIKANRSFYDFFRVTPSDTIGTLIYDLGNNQWDIPKLRELLETILPDKRTLDDYEIEHEFPTIGKRILFLNARIIRQVMGKEEIIVLVFEDCTERKRMEEVVHETEERFRVVFDNLFDGISIYYEDPDASKRRLIECNEQYATLAGRSRNELLQLGVTQSLQIQHEDKANNLIEFPDRRTTHRQGTFSWVRPDGKENIIEYRGIPIIWKGKPYTIGLDRDITERKRSEDELRKSENKMRMIVEGTPYLFFYTQDTDGKITYISPSIEKITGHSVETWLKQSHWFITDNEINKHAKEITHAHLRGEFTDGPILIEIEHADKHPVLLEAFETPIIVKGVVTGLQGVAHDITDRERTKQEMIEAKEKAESANKVKDAFIANISHEIRTPLTGILGLSSLIRETFHDIIKEEDKELFEGIDYSGKRLIRTVDMILNYSRLQVGEFPLFKKNLELSNICKNLIRQYTATATRKSLSLTFQNNCGKANLFADEYSIITAISNLIDNAIIYTNRGSVNIILYKQENDDIKLDVKDTGIGIDREFLDKMFDPYLQEQMGYGREYEGLGLGLSLVKKILILNNISINVESKKGEGSTFTLNFGKDTGTA